MPQLWGGSAKRQQACPGPAGYRWVQGLGHRSCRAVSSEPILLPPSDDQTQQKDWSGSALNVWRTQFLYYYSVLFYDGEMILLLYSTLVIPPPGDLHPALGSPAQEGHEHCRLVVPIQVTVFKISELCEEGAACFSEAKGSEIAFSLAL
ncbi:hypothetical protein TURU_127039 [Turdus rufiventris]|nr:hypothetical protein TURU_127039 [Turdus rufiventris]